MVQKRVLVLQHIEIDPAGYLGELLEEHSIPYDVIMVQEGALPDPTAYGAILSMGGPEYAGDEEISYLAEEKALIRRAVEQDIPFLGICLGGQLLASALGAPIVRKGLTEIGFFDARFTEEGMSDPLFAGLPGYQHMFHWHEDTFMLPALLAKTAATLDAISGGRFELGLGAGWMQSEYEQVGLVFDTPGVRIDRMAEALQIIKGLFSDEPLTFAGTYYRVTGMRGHPSPVQRPRPPILLGGTGKRMLSMAAREADIISILPREMLEPGGLQRIDLADARSASVVQKVEWIREAAGERFQELELNLFIVDLALSDRKGDGADRLAGRYALSREQVMESPHLLASTVEQIGEQLQD